MYGIFSRIILNIEQAIPVSGQLFHLGTVDLNRRKFPVDRKNFDIVLPKQSGKVFQRTAICVYLDTKQRNRLVSVQDCSCKLPAKSINQPGNHPVGMAVSYGKRSAQGQYMLFVF